MLPIDQPASNRRLYFTIQSASWRDNEASGFADDASIYPNCSMNLGS